jgi:hypothetical protein
MCLAQLAIHQQLATACSQNTIVEDNSRAELNLRASWRNWPAPANRKIRAFAYARAADNRQALCAALCR